MLDAVAFDLAYRKYASALAGDARRISDNSSDAEDMAHDTWIEAWKARDQLNAPGLWAWLRKVLRRVRWHRLNRNGQKRDGVSVELNEAVSVAVDGDQHEAAQVSQINMAVGALGTIQREVGLMTLAGMDTTEIAKVRGTSHQAASLALRRGVAILRKQWGLT